MFWGSISNIISDQDNDRPKNKENKFAILIACLIIKRRYLELIRLFNKTIINEEELRGINR